MTRPQLGHTHYTGEDLTVQFVADYNAFYRGYYYIRAVHTYSDMTQVKKVDLCYMSLVLLACCHLLQANVEYNGTVYAFNARSNTAQTYMNHHPLRFAVVGVNHDDVYNPSTGRYTCAHSGVYRFSWAITSRGGAEVTLEVGGRDEVTTAIPHTMFGVTATSDEALVWCAATETVHLKVEAGACYFRCTTAQVDLLGRFSGYLVEADLV